jgi:hypothetical protein
MVSLIKLAQKQNDTLNSQEIFITLQVCDFNHAAIRYQEPCR